LQVPLISLVVLITRCESVAILSVVSDTEEMGRRKSKVDACRIIFVAFFRRGGRGKEGKRDPGPDTTEKSDEKWENMTESIVGFVFSPTRFSPHIRKDKK
jgi:hypothetical protein